MPNIGDKVTFHYGRVGEVKPFPATVASVWPLEKDERGADLPQALVLDVELDEETAAAGINPKQSHSVQTDPASPESGGWTGA